MVLVFFVPESPRFLMAQGKTEEARAFLVKYRESSFGGYSGCVLMQTQDGNNNPESKLVHLEVEEMLEGIKLDGIDKRWWDCESTCSCYV